MDQINCQFCQCYQCQAGYGNGLTRFDGLSEKSTVNSDSQQYCFVSIALRYLRDLHNSFHDGLSVTFNDAVEGIKEVEAVSWRSENTHLAWG